MNENECRCGYGGRASAHGVLHFFYQMRVTTEQFRIFSSGEFRFIPNLIFRALVESCFNKICLDSRSRCLAKEEKTK